MTDNYQPDWGSLPPEVMAVLAKTPDQYTGADTEVLKRFLLSPPPYTDPQIMAIVGGIYQQTLTAPNPPAPNDVFLNSGRSGGTPPLATQTQTPVTPPAGPIIPEMGQPMGDLGPVLSQPGVSSYGTTPTDWKAEAGARAGGLGAYGDPTQSAEASRAAGGTPSLTDLPGGQRPIPTAGQSLGPPIQMGENNYNPPTSFGSAGQQVGVKTLRERRHRPGEDGGGGENWKLAALQFGLDPSSAFHDVTRAGANLYVNDPYLAAYRMSGGDPGLASMMAPEVQQALFLSRSGLLSGHGAKKGFAGPDSPAVQLAQTEQFLNSMEPGQFLDPQKIMRQTMKRAVRTPIEKLEAGAQGPGGELAQQIETTNNALILSVGASLTKAGAEGLAAQLDRASDAWLLRKSEGDPITYPAFLKEIGAKGWISKSIV